MGAYVARVIVSDDGAAGEGVEGDPYRVVRRLYTLDGDLILEWDTWRQEEPTVTGVMPPREDSGRAF